MKNRSGESATLLDVIVRCGQLTPGATSLDDMPTEDIPLLPSDIYQDVFSA